MVQEARRAVCSVSKFPATWIVGHGQPLAKARVGLQLGAMLVPCSVCQCPE